MSPLSKEDVEIKAGGGHGYVKVDSARLAKANQNRHQRDVFDKEHQMCKTLSANGYNVTMIEESPRESSCDIIMDGKLAELKSMTGSSNVYKYGVDAINRKRAELVIFMFAGMNDRIRQQLERLSDKGIKGFYYVKGSSKLERF